MTGIEFLTEDEARQGDYHWMFWDHDNFIDYPEPPKTLDEAMRRAIMDALVTYDRTVVEKVFLVEHQLTFPEWKDHISVYGNLDFHVLHASVAMKDGYMTPLRCFYPDGSVHNITIRFEVGIIRHNPTDMIIEYSKGTFMVRRAKRISILKFDDGFHNEELLDLPGIIKTAWDRGRKFLETHTFDEDSIKKWDWV